MSGQPPTQFNAEQLYAQYQNVVKQLEMMDSQLEALSTLAAELQTNTSTIRGLRDKQGDDEVIIPLNGKILLKTKLSTIEEVLVNVGSDVILPSNFEEATKILEDQLKEIQEVYSNLSEQRAQLDSYAYNLQGQLNQLERR